MFIESVTLRTPSIEDCRNFYSNTLGLEELNIDESLVEFNIGQSKLRFQKDDDFAPYHYAIAIPPSLEDECLQFTKDNLRHCKGPTGQDVVNFSNWNSRSVYFRDHDSNVVEFIARRDIQYDYEESFSPKCFQLINEMGLVVKDIEKSYKKLNEALNCKIYSGDTERFSAIGDKNGLLITIDKKKESWFPTEVKPDYADFEAILRNGINRISLKATDGSIELHHLDI